MTERLICGALTALALCITAIVVALFLAIYRGGPGVPETLAVWSAVPKLLLVVATIGFLGGVILGPIRAVNLLSHLWGTAQPRRLAVTVMLWVLLIALWFAAFAYGKP
jgi:hypothetical protein